MIILSTRKRKTYTAAATEEPITEMVNKEEPAVVECHTYTDESVEPTSEFETIVESEPVEPAVESEPELDIVPEVEECGTARFVLSFSRLPTKVWFICKGVIILCCTNCS